jgi:hypothetical protein
MKTKLILLFAVVLAISVNVASAQSYHDAKTQQERIKKGYKSGRLTPAEARQLAYQQQQIRKKTYRAKCNDGRISRSERARIMREKQIASRNIYSYNHNNRSRF